MSDKIEIMVFTAIWCGHCKPMKEVLLQLEEQFDNVRLTIIDVDEEPNIVATYGVKALPTVIVLKKDQDFIRFSGMKTKKELIDLLGL